MLQSACTLVPQLWMEINKKKKKSITAIDYCSTYLYVLVIPNLEFIYQLERTKSWCYQNEHNFLLGLLKFLTFLKNKNSLPSISL